MLVYKLGQIWFTSVLQLLPLKSAVNSYDMNGNISFLLFCFWKEYWTVTIEDKQIQLK